MNSNISAAIGLQGTPAQSERCWGTWTMDSIIIKEILFHLWFKFSITVGAELLSALSHSIHTPLQQESLGQGIQMSFKQAHFNFLS